MTKIYRVNEFAQRVGKETKTLRRWDEEGRLPAKRTPGGHRDYDDTDLRKALGIEPPPEKRKVVVYCRVSSSGQTEALRTQVEAVEKFSLGGGIAVDEWQEEIGGGMNFKRKKVLALMEAVELGEGSKIVIANKDRLVRFGFEWFE